MNFKVTRHHMNKPAIMHNDSTYPGVQFPDATTGNLFVEIQPDNPLDDAPVPFLAITFDEVKKCWNISTKSTVDLVNK